MQEDQVTQARSENCAQCGKGFNPEYGGFDKYVLHAEDFPGISAEKFPLFGKNLCVDCWQDALDGDKNLYAHSLQNPKNKSDK